jgi:hypothetical protein
MIPDWPALSHVSGRAQLAMAATTFPTSALPIFDEWIIGVETPPYFPLPGSLFSRLTPFCCPGCNCRKAKQSGHSRVQLL